MAVAAQGGDDVVEDDDGDVGDGSAFGDDAGEEEGGDVGGGDDEDEAARRRYAEAALAADQAEGRLAAYPTPMPVARATAPGDVDLAEAEREEEQEARALVREGAVPTRSSVLGQVSLDGKLSIIRPFHHEPVDLPVRQADEAARQEEAALEQEMAVDAVDAGAVAAKAAAFALEEEAELPPPPGPDAAPAPLPVAAAVAIHPEHHIDWRSPIRVALASDFANRRLLFATLESLRRSSVAFGVVARLKVHIVVPYDEAPYFKAAALCRWPRNPDADNFSFAFQLFFVPYRDAYNSTAALLHFSAEARATGGASLREALQSHAKGIHHKTIHPLAYARYYLPDLLPEQEHSDRVLWLDAGTIVNGNVGDLYGRTVAMDSYGFAAVPLQTTEETGPPDSGAFDHQNTIEIGHKGAHRADLAEDHRPFRSSPMLLNLGYWRASHLTDAVEGWLRDRLKHGSSLFRLGVLAPLYLASGKLGYLEIEPSWAVPVSDAVTSPDRFRAAKAIFFHGRFRPWLPNPSPLSPSPIFAEARRVWLAYQLECVADADDTGDIFESSDYDELLLDSTTDVADGGDELDPEPHVKVAGGKAKAHSHHKPTTAASKFAAAAQASKHDAKGAEASPVARHVHGSKGATPTPTKAPRSKHAPSKGGKGDKGGGLGDVSAAEVATRRLKDAAAKAGKTKGAKPTPKPTRSPDHGHKATVKPTPKPTRRHM
jgi:hypothetical protein